MRCSFLLLSLLGSIATPAAAATFDITYNGTISAVNGVNRLSIGVGDVFKAVVSYDDKLGSLTSSSGFRSLYGGVSAGTTSPVTSVKFNSPKFSYVFGNVANGELKLITGYELDTSAANANNSAVLMANIIDLAGTFPVTFTSFSVKPDPAGYGTFYVDFGSGQFTNLDLSIQQVALSAPVPEPATWGMMILGFGLVGGAIRRRQMVAASTVAA